MNAGREWSAAWLATLLALVVFLVSPLAVAKAGGLSPKQAIKKIESGEVAPFKKKVRTLCGSGVKVTVRFEAAGSPNEPYFVKDVGAYLVRAAPGKQLTINGLSKVVEALNAVASDPAGKKALRTGLKEVVILAVVGTAQLSFKDGVLTYGSHIFGDGQGSSIGADAVQRALENGLGAPEPATGTTQTGASNVGGAPPATGGLALNRARAIEKLEAEQTAPFRAKVLAIAPSAKVVVEYAPPTDQDKRSYPVKDPAAFLVRAAACTNLTINSFDMVLEALTDVAADELGKRALHSQLKSVVVYAVVGEGFHSYKDGVLTVATHIFGDGRGSSIPADTTRKDLEWGLLAQTPRLTGSVALAHARAIEKLEAEQTAPFRNKVLAIVPGTKVTVEYEPAPDQDKRGYPVKDPGAFLVRAAGSTNLTINLFDNVVEALTEIASDESGKRALRSQLRSVVVYAAVGEAFLSYKDGVLTVGSHIFGDGEGSSLSATDIRKALAK